MTTRKKPATDVKSSASWDARVGSGFGLAGASFGADGER